jgi:hypothetical protein
MGRHKHFRNLEYDEWHKPTTGRGQKHDASDGNIPASTERNEAIKWM